MPIRQGLTFELTSKSVSSMKLHRDIGVSQKTAWFMLMRIREAWAGDPCGPYSGPVEFDEAYFGGQRKSMSNAKRRGLTGRGPVGKTAVVGAKDRASNQVTVRVVQSTEADTLQGFVTERTLRDATVYTDDATAYRGVPRTREAVRQSVGEYVLGITLIREKRSALIRRGTVDKLDQSGKVRRGCKKDQQLNRRGLPLQSHQFPSCRSESACDFFGRLAK